MAGTEDMTSELLSVICIVCCVLAFYLYLQRLELPHLASSMEQDPEPVPETKVVATTLPFSLSFPDDPAVPASLKDGVQVAVQVSVACSLQAFWVVECTGLTELLQSCDGSHDMCCDEVLETNLEQLSRSHADRHFFTAGTSQDIHVAQTEGGAVVGDSPGCGGGMDTEEGPTPTTRTRTSYPLVVLMRQAEAEQSSGSHSVSIDAMLWVVHLPDEALSSRLQVISQLLVTSQGRIYPLQKLFMAAEDEDRGMTQLRDDSADPLHASKENGNSVNSRGGRESANLASEDNYRYTNSNADLKSTQKSCTVCQNAPLTRVIIPCRHACVCEHCLPLLNACPICRGGIASHFKIGHERPWDTPVVAREEEEEDVDWVIRIQNMMERLNAWFGIR